MNSGNVRSEIAAPEYHALYGAQMQHGDPGSQQPHRMITPYSPTHPDTSAWYNGDPESWALHNGDSNPWAWHNVDSNPSTWQNGDPESWALHHGGRSQPYPPSHSQGQGNEPYASHTDELTIFGAYGARPPSQNGQAMRMSLEDQSEIQEVSREAWQAANEVSTERRARSRARSMAQTNQQTATQRLASFTSTLPVLEPRIRMLIPVCISGRSLMPPPMQALETAFQVQEPVLVEGREVSVVEGQHEK
ncbi:uncharacterized protein TrAtP1_002051 [Trichoderma atroviride]|uniref:uncharacterized protein n=1 Tax=Hypocrea atroviridis TaxID=63577 RepID=UPI00332D88BB|nr:hypothetical protein TrAtP1_002051 [Trichoderma atroviride]